MVLENVKEMWTETPKLAGGKKGRPVNKDRFISKMYVKRVVSPGLILTVLILCLLQVPERRFGHSSSAQLEKSEGIQPYGPVLPYTAYPSSCRVSK